MKLLKLFYVFGILCLFSACSNDNSGTEVQVDECRSADAEVVADLINSLGTELLAYDTIQLDSIMNVANTADVEDYEIPSSLLSPTTLAKIQSLTDVQIQLLSHSVSNKSVHPDVSNAMVALYGNECITPYMDGYLLRGPCFWGLTWRVARTAGLWASGPVGLAIGTVSLAETIDYAINSDDC